MNTPLSSIRVLLVCLALTLVTGVSCADDTEIFTGGTTISIPPNIMLVIDTSGSMGTTVYTHVAYDPTQNYGGSCDNNAVYFIKYTGTTTTAPKCTSTSARFSNTLLRCAAGASAIGNSTNAPGFYTDQFVQWQRAGTTTFSYAWNASLSSSATTGFEVACQGDDGVASPYPSTYNGATNSAGNQWTTTVSADYWHKTSTTRTSYTIYSGNYLNWYNYDQNVAIGTRLSVVQSAADSLVNSLSNVNIGLARYSTTGLGGYIVSRTQNVSTGSNRANLTASIDALQASGTTPLTETMYEVFQYMSGGPLVYGKSSRPAISSVSSRQSATTTSALYNSYQSPVQYSCQKNYIVYLTDGLPNNDTDANAKVLALPNEATLGGPCDDPTKAPYTTFGGTYPTDGICLKALTKYMFNGDASASLSGQQSITPYMIGFGNDPALKNAFSYLQNAATAAGGQAYTAGDLNSLQDVLSTIFSNILQVSTTFTAPTVAVNAFNRTQTLNDLYVSVFQPSSNYHWPGNVKRYLVQNGVILDANGNPAVDPATGFFSDSAQSYWSASPDGSKVTSGGAASQLPTWDPAASPPRNLYTFIGANPSAPVDLSSNSSYAITTANSLLTQTLLGVPDDPTRTNVINYARGEDIRDENANGTNTDARRTMGDPLHAQPAVVVYGGTPGAQDAADSVIYAPTNDGFLHAIRSSDGVELWAFVPQELLGQLSQTYANSPTAVKHYSLDGAVRVIKYDVNGDGVIDPAAGDRVVLYFGQGRGGSNYYAIDVTNKTAPKFLWSIGPTQLPGLGQAWSNPVVAKVNVGGGTQTSVQKLVLVFAGGYDTVEEIATYTTQDTVGRAIYMVDAVSGALLWSAGGTGSGANLILSRMDHAISSDVTVLDTNGDGFADRMYVGDLGGQLWRFDITNGNPKSTLVAGGVIASLGAHDDGTKTAANTRRFYSAPDASIVSKKGLAGFINLAIGSGYRGHPLDETAQDRMYSVRDYNPFTALTQAQYNALTVIHDTDLTDITKTIPATIAANAPGWKMLLNQPGDSWIGEKSLASAVTFNGQILFTTYIPGAGTDPCQPVLGTNRFYAVSTIDGSPVANLNNQNNATIADRYTTLKQLGIAPALAFLFPASSTSSSTSGGTQTTGTTAQTPVVCMTGVEVLSTCRSFQSKIKTYWNEADAP